MMKHSDKMEATETAKRAGMDSGELTTETVIRIARDAVASTDPADRPTAADCAAIHARAAYYCCGEYVANYYETPRAERPDYEPQAHFGELFGMVESQWL